MLPMLSPGDRVLALRAGRVRRGDVWVVRLGGGLLVKRMVGLPGDRVSVIEGRARIDEAAPVGERPGPQPDGSWVLGPDEYLVQGDNPEESTDVRAFGPVGPDDLVGRVVLRYRPRPGRVR
jgi:signal peptidase I